MFVLLPSICLQKQWKSKATTTSYYQLQNAKQPERESTQTNTDSDVDTNSMYICVCYLYMWCVVVLDSFTADLLTCAALHSISCF